MKEFLLFFNVKYVKYKKYLYLFNIHYDYYDSWLIQNIYTSQIIIFKISITNPIKMAQLSDDLDFGINLGNNDAKVQQQTNQAKYNPSSKQAINQLHVTSSSNDNVNEQNSIGKGDYDLSAAGHPSICIATFAFKAASILMYFPLGYALSTIIMFIFVLILAAMDFWVVKNISGRLLVGLRWKSQYDQKGRQVWKYQSYDKKYEPNRVDKAFFWGSQVLGTIIWGFFLIINILGLNFFNCTLLFICTSLCFTNLYGYYNCRGDHQKKLTDLKKKYGAKGMLALAGRFV